MITVSEKLREIIGDSPFLEEGLDKGIINLSALARELKPELEKSLMKDLSEGAIMMALKRLPGKAPKRDNGMKDLGVGDLAVRSRLKEYTFRKSSTLLERQEAFLNQIDSSIDYFFTVTQGAQEVTLIVSDTLEAELKQAYAPETLIMEIDDLAAITIKFKEKITGIPGVYYSILKQLAWKNINVIEVVSTFLEFTVILERKDVDKSFGVLLNYIG